MILDEIVARRKIQLSREKEALPPALMERRALDVNRVPLDFYAAMKKKGISVIAEVKKASPSKGLIRPDFYPADIAKSYENAGAAAISCLTEERYFQGHNRYLRDIRQTVALPILRKDFIFDPYQIYHAKALGADAVLLIAAMLDKDRLQALYALAKGLGLYSLVEVHNEQELESAMAAGADIIGVNNRNLRTFQVDLGVTERLSPLLPETAAKISESGIASHDDVERLAKLGIDGILVGESFMRSGDIEGAFRRLMEG